MVKDHLTSGIVFVNIFKVNSMKLSALKFLPLVLRHIHISIAYVCACMSLHKCTQQLQSECTQHSSCSPVVTNTAGAANTHLQHLTVHHIYIYIYFFFIIIFLFFFFNCTDVTLCLQRKVTIVIKHTEKLLAVH